MFEANLLLHDRLLGPLRLLRLELELRVSTRRVLVPIQANRVELRSQPDELGDGHPLRLVLELAEDLLVVIRVQWVVLGVVARVKGGAGPAVEVWLNRALD